MINDGLRHIRSLSLSVSLVTTFKNDQATNRQTVYSRIECEFEGKSRSLA